MLVAVARFHKPDNDFSIVTRCYCKSHQDLNHLATIIFTHTFVSTILLFPAPISPKPRPQRTRAASFISTYSSISQVSMRLCQIILPTDDGLRKHVTDRRTYIPRCRERTLAGGGRYLGTRPHLERAKLFRQGTWRISQA